MNFELTGMIAKIYETEQKTPTFKVREFVIQTSEEKYPQSIKFQLKNDRTDLIEQYAEGEGVTVSFNIEGREWQGKYFTTLVAWKLQRGIVSAPPIEAVKVEPTPTAIEVPTIPTFNALPVDHFKPVGSDDLPF